MTLDWYNFDNRLPPFSWAAPQKRRTAFCTSLWPLQLEKIDYGFIFQCSADMVDSGFEQWSTLILSYSFIIIINCILAFSHNDIQYSVQCPTQRDLYYDQYNYYAIFKKIFISTGEPQAGSNKKNIIS